MIIALLWYVSTGVTQRPAELACRSLHDLVHDADCIFVPGQIFPGGKNFIFDFSMCQLSRHQDTIAGGGYLAYVGYIKEPRWILDLCQLSSVYILVGINGQDHIVSSSGLEPC